MMKKSGSAAKKNSAAKKKPAALSNNSGLSGPEKIKSSNQFPIVAIGASAGGLEAMTEFLKNLPSHTGMAFIYVQHLSPDHKSMLTQILSKDTKMKVQEIDNMDKIKPDNVFVIPHNKAIEVTDGRMKLIPRPANSSAISIDILFTSLAQAQKERVIGIILSGSAGDGSRGIRDIKQEGGLTFAQDDTAKFRSMPHSAIATGFIDFIMSPKEMAGELTRLSKHPLLGSKGIKPRQEALIENDDPDLQNVLQQMQQALGVDFRAYKMNTIKRRIIRRMVLQKVNSLKEYGALLKAKKEETDLLYRDLLINVTSFFRDPDTYKYLQTTLLPKILKSKKNGASLRIWVPACSTGEEVFSIAIMLYELQDGKSNKIPVQIFGTDINADAIAKGRVGIFSKDDIENVSPKRIQKFFTKTDLGYRIIKPVREMCVFAPHNILKDPSFSRLDFISCCNLLIYLDSPAQKKVISTFHYALNDDGYLMLGKSEAINSASQFFAADNKKFKIFTRKKNSGDRPFPGYSQSLSHLKIDKDNFAGWKAKNLTASAKKSSLEIRNLDNAINDVLVSQFLPASVVINDAMEILQFRGTTDLYFTHAPGKASLNVLKMARPEIAFDLRSTIAKAIKTKKRVRKSGVEMKRNEGIRIISIEAVPLKIEWDEPLFLILFTDHEQMEFGGQVASNAKNNNTAKDRKIKKLEDELAAMQADTLAFTQEQEAFAEELQSANEEVVSSNEELQTINDELETSKEEIESVNEELRTANEELQTRNELLNEAYEYNEAIMATIHDPMLVLDKDLRVRSGNKTFYKNFHVKEPETEGSLVYDLGSRQWNIPKLREFLDDIILKNTFIHNFEVTHDFPHLGSRIMLLNARRIIQKVHREQLILLIIVDITDRKNAENKIKEANEQLIQKNEELQKMNKELEAFAYISGHDLQEPLRKIQTFAERIMEKEGQKLGESARDYFRRMQDAAARMKDLINDLLSFSRLHVSERKFELIRLNDIIEEAEMELKENIVERHATIEVRKDIEIKVIPFQFRQLMQNLIGNALKFSNPGLPPHITISGERIKHSKNFPQGLSPEKEYCHINVTDNGIGFESEFAEKIFEVFQKLHNKEEYPGTGIGLAIVKKIVDNHNGVITVSSRLGEGTSFDIYIPG